MFFMRKRSLPSSSSSPTIAIREKRFRREPHKKQIISIFANFTVLSPFFCNHSSLLDLMTKKMKANREVYSQVMAANYVRFPNTV